MTFWFFVGGHLPLQTIWPGGEGGEEGSLGNVKDSGLALSPSTLCPPEKPA